MKRTDGTQFSDMLKLQISRSVTVMYRKREKRIYSNTQSLLLPFLALWDPLSALPMQNPPESLCKGSKSGRAASKWEWGSFWALQILRVFQESSVVAGLYIAVDTAGSAFDSEVAWTHCPYLSPETQHHWDAFFFFVLFLLTNSLQMYYLIKTFALRLGRMIKTFGS